MARSSHRVGEATRERWKRLFRGRSGVQDWLERRRLQSHFVGYEVAMKLNFCGRIKAMMLKQAANIALAIIDRQIEKETPEQQERLLEVRRSLVLMRRLVDEKARRSGRNRRRPRGVLVADTQPVV